MRLGPEALERADTDPVAVGTRAAFDRVIDEVHGCSTALVEVNRAVA